MNEKLKSPLLFFLFGLMIVLFYISLTMGLQGEGGGIGLLFGKRPPSDVDFGIEEEWNYQAAATPIKLAIRGDIGLYVPQAAAQMDESYKQIEPIFNEAIGSAGVAETVSAKEYLDSFLLPSVYVAYDMQVPVYVLRMWVGFEFYEGDAKLERMLLCEKNDEVVMYFVDGATGNYCMAKTAAAPERLEQICSSITQVTGVYAFEDKRFSSFAPDEPIFTGSMKMPAYSVLPPTFADAGELSRQTLQAFGFNAYLTKIYPDAADITVYVEGLKTLRMSKSGDLTYASTGGDGVFVETAIPQWMPGEKVAAQVEFVRKIVTNIWSSVQGGGSLSLDSITKSNSGYDMTFEIKLNGCFVYSKSGAAVSVKIADNHIVYMKISPRRYVESGEKLVLPLEQAAAILGNRRNIRPAVRYVESRGGLLEAVPTYIK